MPNIPKIKTLSRESPHRRRSDVMCDVNLPQLSYIILKVFVCVFVRLCGSLFVCLPLDTHRYASEIGFRVNKIYASCCLEKRS